MLSDNIPGQSYIRPLLAAPDPPNDPSGPTLYPALRLWSSIHRLSSLLAAISATHRQSSLLHRHPTSCPTPNRPRQLAPSSQIAFHNWLHTASITTFHCLKPITGTIFPIEAPPIGGLGVYGSRNNQTRFYGAWTERSGIFMGWMRMQPQISGIDAVYAVGEVLERPVFIDTSPDLSVPEALDMFVQALKEAAWDLGVA